MKFKKSLYIGFFFFLLILTKSVAEFTFCLISNDCFFFSTSTYGS